ncbi:MAG: polysaccharide biosynthesis C-terminal domain-containing protein [Novosphingobium sp.]
MKMALIFKAGFASLVLRVVSIVLEFAIILLLGRMLGPAGLGVYAFYYALIRLISIPLTAGLPTLSLREIAQTQALEQFGLMRGFIRRSTQFILLFSGLLLIAGLIGLWSRGDGLQVYWGIEIYALLLIPLVAISNLRGAMMRGLGYVVSGQLPEFALRPGVFSVLLLVGILVAPEHADPANAMLLHLVAALLAFVIGIALFLRVLPKEARVTAPEYADRRWITAIVPFSIIAGIQIVNSQAAISVLGFYGLDTEAGLFRLAQQISLIAVFPITALSLVVAPLFAKAHAQGEKEWLQELMQVCTTVIFAFGLLFFVVSVLLAEPLIRLVFGEDFEGSYTPLIILLIGQLFNCFTGALYPLLKMIGEEKAFAWVAGVGAAINVVFAMGLATPYGANGVAVATAASLTFVSIVLGVYSLRVLNINPFPTKKGWRNTWRSAKELMGAGLNKE